jgi:hypothetical protein
MVQPWPEQTPGPHALCCKQAQIGLCFLSSANDLHAECITTVHRSKKWGQHSEEQDGGVAQALVIITLVGTDMFGNPSG